MRIVLQRSGPASVVVDDKVVGEISSGLVALIGVADGDDSKIIDAMADKVAHLRIFADENGKMNQSLRQAGGDVLAVSQFTLLADCRKGRRPAFTGAAAPETAKSLYLRFVDQLRQHDVTVATGIFAADMQVSLVNDGPVTIVLDSQEILPSTKR